MRVRDALLAALLLIAAVAATPVLVAASARQLPAPAPQQPPATPQQPPATPGTPPPAVPPGQPAPATAPAPVAPAPAVPVARIFTAPAGLLFNTVRADRVADFEKVLAYLHAALEKSSDATVRAQASSWKVFKATEPGPNSTVLYVFSLDPTVANADYSLGRILADAYPDTTQLLEIWKLYQASVTSGGSLLNLTPVVPPATLPPLGGPGVPPAPVPPGNPATSPAPKPPPDADPVRKP